MQIKQGGFLEGVVPFKLGGKAEGVEHVERIGNRRVPGGGVCANPTAKARTHRAGVGT